MSLGMLATLIMDRHRRNAELAVTRPPAQRFRTAAPRRDVAAGTITGGCLCGRVRFEATGPLISPHVCSCPHCQRWAGGPAVSWADVTVNGFVWTGVSPPSWYRTYPDSARGFCWTCGSSVCVVDDGAELLGVTLSSLDDGQAAADPESLTFGDDAPPWFRSAFDAWVGRSRAPTTGGCDATS